MAYTVRTRDFRYVGWRDTSDRHRIVHRELYDHRDGPDETQSVADQAQFAGAVAMHEKLAREGFASLRQRDTRHD